MPVYYSTSTTRNAVYVPLGTGMIMDEEHKFGNIIPLITKYYPRLQGSARTFRRTLEERLKRKYPLQI